MRNEKKEFSLELEIMQIIEMASRLITQKHEIKFKHDSDIPKILERDLSLLRSSI